MTHSVIVFPGDGNSRNVGKEKSTINFYAVNNHGDATPCTTPPILEGNLSDSPSKQGKANVIKKIRAESTQAFIADIRTLQSQLISITDRVSLLLMARTTGGLIFIKGNQNSNKSGND